MFCAKGISKQKKILWDKMTTKGKYMPLRQSENHAMKDSLELQNHDCILGWGGEIPYEDVFSTSR